MKEIQIGKKKISPFFSFHFIDWKKGESIEIKEEEGFLVVKLLPHAVCEGVFLHFSYFWMYWPVINQPSDKPCLNEKKKLYWAVKMLIFLATWADKTN